MMKSILIDTDVSILERLASYLGRIGDVEVVGKFTNSLEALPVLNKNEIDVVFLEVEMPFLSGIELFKKADCSSRFIFMAKDTSYRIETFQSNAGDYLLKPISFNNLLSAISKARNSYGKDRTASINITSAGAQNPSASSEAIVIETESEAVTVKAEDIKYIQTVKGVSKIYAKKYRGPIVMTSSKERLLAKLPDYFLQVHESFIINSCLIQAVQKRKVIIEGMHIPIGKAYENSIMEHLAY